MRTYALALLASVIVVAAAAAPADAKLPCRPEVTAPAASGGKAVAKGRIRCTQATGGTARLTLVLVLESGGIDKRTVRLRGPFRRGSRGGAARLACRTAPREDPIVEANTELILTLADGRKRAKTSRGVDWATLCPQESADSGG